MSRFLICLFAIITLSYTSTAQKTKETAKCKCEYPFKSSCSDYCIKTLFHNSKFKADIAKARLADSTRTKLENWSKDSINNQSLESVITQKEMAKVDGVLQNYFSDPDNIERSSSRFMQSAGATISILFGKEQAGNSASSSNFSLAQTNLSYFPRVNIVQNQNSSLSIGAPVGIGIGIASNTLGGDAGVAFAYDLPIVVDYNFGCKSTRQSRKNFGGYFGAGFGYYHVSISQSAYSDFTGTTYGPMGRAGIRFEKENWDGKGVTIGVFYKKGLEAVKFQTLGFNVYVDF